MDKLSHKEHATSVKIPKGHFLINIKSITDFAVLDLHGMEY